MEKWNALWLFNASTYHTSGAIDDSPIEQMTALGGALIGAGSSPYIGSSLFQIKNRAESVKKAADFLESWAAGLRELLQEALKEK